MELAACTAALHHAVVLCLFLASSLQGLYAEKMPMKVVDEPVIFGPSNNDNDWHLTDAEDQLTLRMKPANFSGPLQLRHLLQQCFQETHHKYKYVFCPFDNLTQHEVSTSWNPYKGVLGVWEEWKIMNNTFVAMVMGEGDTCGKISRTTEVSFVCGHSNKIVNVSEPVKCQYQLIFSTSLVCHDEAMLVYPRLPVKLRHRWNKLETALHHGEITDKGYQKGVRWIFEEAGFQLPAAVKESLMMTSKAQPSKADTFHTLLQCEKEYLSLQKEIQNLKAELKKKEEALLVSHKSKEKFGYLAHGEDDDNLYSSL